MSRDWKAILQADLGQLRSTTPPATRRDRDLAPSRDADVTDGSATPRSGSHRAGRRRGRGRPPPLGACGRELEGARLHPVSADAAAKANGLHAEVMRRYGVGPHYAEAYLSYWARARGRTARSLDEILARPQPEPMWFDFAMSANWRGEQLAERSLPLLPAGARRYLDVGCGFGGYLVAFARRGLDVAGIEIDPVRIELARANLAGRRPRRTACTSGACSRAARRAARHLRRDHLHRRDRARRRRADRDAADDRAAAARRDPGAGDPQRGGRGFGRSGRPLRPVRDHSARSRRRARVPPAVLLGSLRRRRVPSARLLRGELRRARLLLAAPRRCAPAEARRASGWRARSAGIRALPREVRSALPERLRRLLDRRFAAYLGRIGAGSRSADLAPRFKRPLRPALSPRVLDAPRRQAGRSAAEAAATPR